MAGRVPREVWLDVPKAPLLRPSVPRSRPGAGTGGASGDGAAAPRFWPRAARAPRPRYGRVGPAGGASAGLSLCPSGRASLDSLPPCLPRSAPARVPPARARRPHPGREEEDREFLEGTSSPSAQEKGRRTRGRRGWWRRIPRLRPAARWPGARRCGGCTSRPSGRSPRSCSACPGPQVGLASPRPPGRI